MKPLLQDAPLSFNPIAIHQVRNLSAFPEDFPLFLKQQRTLVVVVSSFSATKRQQGNEVSDSNFAICTCFAERSERHLPPPGKNRQKERERERENRLASLRVVSTILASPLSDEPAATFPHASGYLPK